MRSWTAACTAAIKTSIVISVIFSSIFLWIMGARGFDVWYGQQTLWCDRVPLPSVPTHVNNIYYIWVYTINLSQVFKLCIQKYCQPCQENLCLTRLTFCMRKIHFCQQKLHMLDWIGYVTQIFCGFCLCQNCQNCGFKSGKYKRLTIPMHCSRVFMHVLLFFVLRHVFCIACLVIIDVRCEIQDKCWKEFQQ